MGRLAPMLLGATLVAVAAAGCRDARIPLPQVPQLREASELSQYGGERARAAHACQSSSGTTDAYLACMETAGWVFMPRGNLYPANECWGLRDAGDPRRLPAAHCFHKAGSPPHEPAADEPTPPAVP